MKRLELDDWRDLATVINETPRNAAYALGALDSGLPPVVTLVAKRDPRSKEPGFVVRSKKNISQEEGAPGFILIDVDTKGMPPAVKRRLTEPGVFLGALAVICPGFDNAGQIRHASTSAGLMDKKTKASLPGSDGLHIYVLVRDASDARRFLYTLHDRAWLHGLGWHIVGAAGQLLERAIVDRSVCDPSRLVFEAPPDLKPPHLLGQQEREAIVHNGRSYDTITRLVDLNNIEAQTLKKLKSGSADALANECKHQRAIWEANRIAKDVDGGKTSAVAHRLVAKMLDERILLPSVLLKFDDDEMGEVTVGAVLDDPMRYDEETLADEIIVIPCGFFEFCA